MSATHNNPGVPRRRGTYPPVVGQPCVEEVTVFSRLGPLEVHCDAPSYAMVRTCHALGFHAPLDVRWCRMSHYLSALIGWKGLFNRNTWKMLWETRARGEKACFCGEQLPRLMMYTFTLNTGEELSFFLGQCSRCHSVFWEQVSAVQQV